MTQDIVADIVRTDRAMKALEARRKELTAKLIEQGGIGTKYETPGFTVTVGLDEQDSLSEELARELFPDRYDEALEDKRAEVKLTLTDARKSFTGKELAQMTIKVPCTVKVTVKHK